MMYRQVVKIKRCLSQLTAVAKENDEIIPTYTVDEWSFLANRVQFLPFTLTPDSVIIPLIVATFAVVI